MDDSSTSTPPPRRTPSPEGPLFTAVLAGLAAITPLSIDILLPALPALGPAFGDAAVRPQLLVSVFVLGFGVAQLVYGPVSDRLGRRPVLLGAMGLYVAASLAALLAPSFQWLLGCRLAQGVGACAGPVLARAAVRDVHEGPRAARVLAFVTSGQSLAPIVAPLAGGLILLVSDWRGLFATLAGAGAVLWAGVFWVIGETHRRRDAGATRPGWLARNYAAIARHPEFGRYVMTIAAGMVGLFAFLAGSPFVLIDVLGLAPYQFGLSFATVMLGQVSGALLSSRLAVTRGIDPTVRLGLALYATGGVAMAALAWSGVRHVAAVVGPMAVFMLGNGLAMPVCLAGAIGPFPRMAGAASALAGFVQMTVGSVASAAVGYLHDGSPRPMATMIAASGLGAAVLFAVMRPGKR
ncbi:MAG: multidrug effflux MFS transporter [Candidatus Rokuibacteriota bacterium]